jgi:hypothetical protein
MPGRASSGLPGRPPPRERDQASSQRIWGVRRRVYRAAAALRAALGRQGETTLDWATMDDRATAHSANSARAEFSGPGPQDPRAYRRLAAAAREQICSGAMSPGQPLPSITELARAHGHARVTCSKAYRLLEAEGLVTRYPGLGYYVAWRARSGPGITAGR